MTIRTDVSLTVELALKEIDTFLASAEYDPHKDPTLGAASSRPDLRRQRLELLTQLDNRKQELKSADHHHADLRLRAILFCFFLTTLIISGIVIYALSKETTDQQLSLIGGALGEGGIFYIVMREYRNFLKESAAIHTRNLVSQAFDFGRFALVTLSEDSDILKVIVMVKEIITKIQSGTDKPRAPRRQKP